MMKWNLQGERLVEPQNIQDTTSIDIYQIGATVGVH